MIIRRRPRASAVHPSWKATSSHGNRRTDGCRGIISRGKKKPKARIDKFEFIEKFLINTQIWKHIGETGEEESMEIKKKSNQFVLLGKKIFGFICSRKISESIILLSTFPSHSSILFCHPVYNSDTYLSQSYLIRKSENKNPNCKRKCLKFSMLSLFTVMYIKQNHIYCILISL